MRFGQRIGAGLVIALLLMTLVGYAGYASIGRLVVDNRTVERTHEIDTRLEHLLSRVKDAETGSRGYVITGDQHYLEPYDTAVASIPTDVTTLRQVIVDPVILQRLDTVDALIDLDIGFMRAPIEARRTAGFAAAQAITLTGRIKATTDSIRRRIGDIQSRLNVLLAARRARTAQSTHAALVVILSGLVAATILTVGAAVLAHEALVERDEVTRARERFFTISLDMLCTAGRDGYFQQVNSAWEQALGYTREEMKSEEFKTFVHPDDQAKTQAEFERLLAGGKSALFENRFRHKDGTYRSMLWSAALDERQELVYGAARDITELKRTQAEVRQLSGLLPICASCKKIRDDKGSWNQIEIYISRRSAAEFSHGICPDCEAKLYGPLDS